MRNWSPIVALLILLGMAIYVPTSVATVEPVPSLPSLSGTFEKYGPRVERLIFKIPEDENEAWMLENGLIDVMDQPVPTEKWEEWLADPNIVMDVFSDAGWYEYDLNLQMWPIGHGAMRPELGAEGGAAPTKPMDWTFPASWDEGHYWINYSCQRDVDARWFRKALAHLTNRAAIESHFPGSISPMETFIFPLIEDWENPSAPRYAHGRTLARECFDDGGFMDYDDDGTREYCKHVTEREAWKTGGPVPPDVEEIPDIQLWMRIDDPVRLFAGRFLRDELIACNIDVDAYEAPYEVAIFHPLKIYDYHIYVGGWKWSTLPDMYYELWHSSKDTYPDSDADNYNRYHRQEYDAIADNFKAAPNMTAAKTYCDALQMMLHDDVGCIPLYTMSGYVAHREYYGDHVGEQQYKYLPWEGFVNELGVGFHSFWTHLNAHVEGYEKGGTLRQGLLWDVLLFHPVFAEEPRDWFVLSRIYEPLIRNNPHNVTEKIPWLCRNWSIGTWQFEGKNCTKITFDLKLRGGPGAYHILWQDGHVMTAEDVAFTFQYMKDSYAPHFIQYLSELDHVEVLDEYTVVVYYQVQSIWALDWAGSIPVIPKHIWEHVPPESSRYWNPADYDAVIGTGPFRCFKDGIVGRVDRLEGSYIYLDGNPLYFRELVQADFSTAGQPVPYFNGRIDIDDFLAASYHFGCSYPWPHSAIDPYADVNKDLIVGVDDLMEIAVRFGDTGYKNGYPPW